MIKKLFWMTFILLALPLLLFVSTASAADWDFDVEIVVGIPTTRHPQPYPPQYPKYPNDDYKKRGHGRGHGRGHNHHRRDQFNNFQREAYQLEKISNRLAELVNYEASFRYRRDWGAQAGRNQAQQLRYAVNQFISELNDCSDYNYYSSQWAFNNLEHIVENSDRVFYEAGFSGAVRDQVQRLENLTDRLDRYF